MKIIPIQGFFKCNKTAFDMAMHQYCSFFNLTQCPDSPDAYRANTYNYVNRTGSAGFTTYCKLANRYLKNHYLSVEFWVNKVKFSCSNAVEPLFNTLGPMANLCFNYTNLMQVNYFFLTKAGFQIVESDLQMYGYNNSFANGFNDYAMQEQFECQPSEQPCL